MIENTKTIKQLDDLTCGVACAAMIARTTFDIAMKAIKPHPKGGYNSIEIAKFLLAHNILIGGSCFGFEDDSELDLYPGAKVVWWFDPAMTELLLGVKSERFPGKEHWIYWDKKNVHDPSPVVDDVNRSLKDYHITTAGPIQRLETE